ncbi:hypothetical protein IQ260_11885 [Leptolyngbya cf. ectocarpi LEGE 11479]|uniref:Uncharacterized protein n=1 Tax=Leptolyngbya cf. ectocarpi LEGE 11479 TaxID=1828722 RepID=A0A929F5Y9_LEPEC|nr:hypothetical protein [Leptolyngbya ectocarpi]MBE9067356.1 hypothetical protein [Leptolyngbya cf. ectocarpi LEGE 11479]
MSAPESQPVHPEVLPPESDQTHVPTAQDLPSHYRNLDWQDGAEFIAEGASGVPFAGPAIKRFIEISTGVGQYRQENRLEDLNWKWLLDQIPILQEKINILLSHLPKEDKPAPADFAAIVKAVLQASEKTADSRKRRLLKNALTSAFNLEQYSNGLTLRLISILEGLEYGDIELLNRISQAEQRVLSSSLDEDEIGVIETFRNQPISKLDKQQIFKSQIVLGNDFELSSTSIVFHHLDVLEKYGLIAIDDYSAMSQITGTLRKVLAWQKLINKQADQLRGSSYVQMPQITSLGQQMLELILKNSSVDPDNVG